MGAVKIFTPFQIQHFITVILLYETLKCTLDSKVFLKSPTFQCYKLGKPCNMQGHHGEFEPGKVQYSTQNFFDRLLLLRAY